MIDRLPRCAAVVAATTAGYAGLLAWLLPLAGAGPAETFEQILARGCAGVAAVAGGWLWVGTALTALAALRRRSPASRLLPAPVGRLVLAACGAALAAGLAVGPAQATPGQPREDRGAPIAVIESLPLPERATEPTVVVVGAGDSLWSIAERDLGPTAADAAVDLRWRQIYALNRAVIGPDPDLILPAQRLRVPPR